MPTPGRRAELSISRPFRAPTTTHARAGRERAAHGGERADQGLPRLGGYQWARAATARHPPPATTRRSVRPASGRPPATAPMAGQARERARTAQFMREWEQRHADRLHQLRGAATGRRARAPARGRPDQVAARGNRDRLFLRPRRKFGNGLRPQRQPARSVAAAAGNHGLAWSIAAEQYDAAPARGGRHCLGQQTSANESEIRARRARQRAYPAKVGNDLAGRVGASEAETKAKIDKGRTQVSQDAGTLSEDKASVRSGKISRNHGEPSGLGYGRRQRESAQPRHTAQTAADRRMALRQGWRARDGPPPNPRPQRSRPRQKPTVAHEPTRAASPASAELIAGSIPERADLEAAEAVASVARVILNRRADRGRLTVPGQFVVAF